MSTTKDYMRSFFEQQRELSNKATEAMAQMAQANIDMIRASGSGVVAARRARAAMLSHILNKGGAHEHDDTPIA